MGTAFNFFTINDFFKRKNGGNYKFSVMLCMRVELLQYAF